MKPVLSWHRLDFAQEKTISRNILSILNLKPELELGFQMWSRSSWKLIKSHFFCLNPAAAALTESDQNLSNITVDSIN